MESQTALDARSRLKDSDGLGETMSEKEVERKSLRNLEELQNDIGSAKEDLLKGEVKRFKNKDEAFAWLHSS
jgi:hypothetical protein